MSLAEDYYYTTPARVTRRGDHTHLITRSMVGRIDSRNTTLFRPRLLKIDMTAWDTMEWCMLRLGSRCILGGTEKKHGKNDRYIHLSKRKYGKTYIQAHIAFCIERVNHRRYQTPLWDRAG